MHIRVELSRTLMKHQKYSDFFLLFSILPLRQLDQKRYKYSKDCTISDLLSSH